MDIQIVKEFMFDVKDNPMKHRLTKKKGEELPSICSELLNPISESKVHKYTH